MFCSGEVCDQYRAREEMALKGVATELAGAAPVRGLEKTDQSVGFLLR